MFDVRLHRKVVTFLKELDTHRARHCKEAIDLVAQNPFVHRPGCDIRKLSGKHVYRLQVGDCRFVYVVEGKMMLIMDAFRRERGH